MLRRSQVTSNIAMEIIVCIKQVIDPESKLNIDPGTGLIEQRGISYIVNPNDEFAVEQALRIRDGLGQGRVTVLTLGPPRVRDALVRCLAMGADECIHIWDKALEGCDVHVTSLVLARAISLLGYALILCGCEAWDDGQGYVGAGIAEELDIPLIARVSRVELSPDGRRATVLRHMERGDQAKVECLLPAVFTIAMRANRPRYPKLRHRLLAPKREIPMWDLKTIGLGEEEVSSLMRLEEVTYPRPRAKKVTTPDSSLSPMERLKFFLAGGVTERAANLLDGSSSEALSKITEFLIEKGIIQREV
jgi:electron transfer flavoprotein beta subunit